MGVGKSSVGQFLAHLLGFEHADTDSRIEAEVGCTVSEIFAQSGEDRFRLLEQELAKSLESTTGMVISTGGGFVLNPVNLSSLQSHAYVICLWASPETILERVRHRHHRPLLKDADPLQQIRSLLDQRTPLYRQADVIVTTEHRSARQVAQQVLSHYQRYH